MIGKLQAAKGEYTYTDDGVKALDVTSLKISYKWKYRKAPKAGLNKLHLLTTWNEKKIVANDTMEKWTEEDEVKLYILSNEVIKIYLAQM